MLDDALVPSNDLTKNNSASDALPRWLRWLPAILLSVFAAVLAARFFTPGEWYLSYFEDDYYYYLIVAKNIVLHGMSSFDNIRPTNGYQPLWQVVNTALYWVFGDHRSFFVALLVVVFALVVGSYRTLRRAQALMGVEGGYGLACALLSITFMAAITRTGMEVSLTLFLLVLLWRRMMRRPLEEQTAVEALLSGLLACGVVLGRLDSLMIVAVYLLLTVAQPVNSRAAAMRAVVWFSVGMLPLAAYFAYNHAVFGTLLPISGVAKNLKSPFIPSISTLWSLSRVRSVNLLLTWPSFLLGILFALRRGGASGQSAAVRRVQMCVLLHPALFYGVLSFTSDWPIWSWYLYPLVPVAALLGPGALAARKALRSRTMVTWATAATGCVSLLTIVGMIRHNSTELLLYQQAQELEEFSKTHPGRYAMGGGAGVPGYVMTSTLVQLEGLMGDAAFLERIRRRQPLGQALEELGVDYYTTMLLDGPQDGPCYKLREPAMAGPRSPVMAGEFCSPVADFHNPEGQRLLIFDVRRLVAGSQGTR